MGRMLVVALLAVSMVLFAGCASGAQGRLSGGEEAGDSSGAANGEPAGASSDPSAGGDLGPEGGRDGDEELGEDELDDEEFDDEEESEESPDYVLPESDKKVYGSDEIERLDDEELFYARNELFARHGARFDDPDLSRYFGAKEWYREIEPKVDDCGSEVLNLAESVNASTLRRIELKRGSKHVKDLDPNRARMYEAYLAKAEERIRSHGPCGYAQTAERNGFTGLCLAQLVDFEADGWEELLLVYNDGSRAPEGDPLNPEVYRVEVWSYEDGALGEVEQSVADSTQAGSSYLLVRRTADGYELGNGKESDGGFLYYYGFSITKNATAGEMYWRDNADISFDSLEIQTITLETLATLGCVDPAVLRVAQLRGDLNTCLVGEVSLVQGDEKEFHRPRQWASLDFDKLAHYVSAEYGDFPLYRIQLGGIAMDGDNQAAWEPYEGQRAIVAGTVRGATWNFWHLTPCRFEDTVVVDFGEGRRTDRRDEVAVGFAKAIRTNYRIENGEYVHERPDRKQYISPTSELYEWHDGNDEGEDILMLGNPSRVDSVEVTEVVGNTYILDMRVCWPRGSLDNEDFGMRSLAVTFNDDDLVEHAHFLL